MRENGSTPGGNSWDGFVLPPGVELLEDSVDFVF